MRFFSAVIFLLCSLSTDPALSQGNLVIAHCLKGCPAGAGQQNELVVRHLYAVSIDPRTRLADWVSYRIVPGSIGVASLLPREWSDDQLSRQSVRVEELGSAGATLVQPNLQNQQDSAYRITEFAVNASDRGRLVPMTSFAATSYWPDLNRLSIVSLMRSDLRLGAWSRLDQAINERVQARGELFVIAGPLPSRATTGQAGADDRYPAAFFKVVASPDGQVAAFVFDRDLPVHAGYCEQLVDLVTLESMAGLDLFPDAMDWPLSQLHNQLGC